MGTYPMPSFLPSAITSAWAQAQCLRFCQRIKILHGHTPNAFSSAAGAQRCTLLDLPRCTPGVGLLPHGRSWAPEMSIAARCHGWGIETGDGTTSGENGSGHTRDQGDQKGPCCCMATRQAVGYAILHGSSFLALGFPTLTPPEGMTPHGAIPLQLTLHGVPRRRTLAPRSHDHPGNSRVAPEKAVVRQPHLILFPFVRDLRECRGDVAIPPSFGPPRRQG